MGLCTDKMVAIDEFISSLSFPQAVSGNPELIKWIPVFTGNHGCPIKNFGHDRKSFMCLYLLAD